MLVTSLAAVNKHLTRSNLTGGFILAHSLRRHSPSQQGKTSSPGRAAGAGSEGLSHSHRTEGGRGRDRQFQ